MATQPKRAKRESKECDDLEETEAEREDIRPETSLSSTAYVEIVRTNLRDDDLHFDLSSILLQSPKTPKLEDSNVVMGKFDPFILKEAIVYNIYAQGISLRTATWRKILAFFDQKFDNLSTKTHLQVLVHYSKLDVELALKSYLERGMPKITREIYYDDLLIDYVTAALMPIEESTTVKNATPAIVEKMISALMKPAVVTALKTCINELSSSSVEKIDGEWIKEEIEQMKIYSADSFLPLKTLRGVTLVDGVLVCPGRLAAAPNFDADLVTLAAHECCHFLARRKFCDFNFSSPYKYTESGKTRLDAVLDSRPLELGRRVELLLFDGIQPSWGHPDSYGTAADTFLKRLDEYTSYPIIKMDEWKELGLTSRMPNLPFGIDLADEIFCVLE